MDKNSKEYEMAWKWNKVFCSPMIEEDFNRFDKDCIDNGCNPDEVLFMIMRLPNEIE